MNDGKLSLSKANVVAEQEYLRRAEKLRVMEEELDKETLLRDISLSVRKSVESEERVMLGSSSVMLSLVSDYFEAMFEGDSQRGESIELSAKITADGIRAIHALALGVLSKVQVSRDNLAALIAAAQYCDVPALSQLCDEFINRFGLITDASVMAQMITDLDHLGFPHLADSWLNKIPSYLIRDLFSDENSIRMDCDLFSSILRKDTLDMDEIDIWNRCLEWASYQARVENDEVITYLHKLKPLIRFPLMNEEFTLKEVMPTKLLSNEEFVAIRSFKYQLLDDSSLFCSSDPRNPTAMVWDPNGIMPSVHSISEDGTLLSHNGENRWANAFIHGLIPDEGTTVIQFKHGSDYDAIYGVMESTEKPELKQHFGVPLKGVGFVSSGVLVAIGNREKDFGEKISKSDRIRLTICYSNPTHATLSFHKNGKFFGRVVNLDEHLDLTHRLRFAVQTGDGRNITILNH